MKTSVDRSPHYRIFAIAIGVLSATLLAGMVGVNAVSAQGPDTPGAIQEQREQAQQQRDSIQREVMPAEAGTATTSRDLPDRAREAQDSRKEVRDRGAEMREQGLERRDQALQSAQERVAANIARILDRFLVALDRFENLVERAESRIEKFAERGVDTSEPEAHIETAREALDEARTEITDIQERLLSSDVSENPRNFFQGIGTVVRDAVDSLREAHRAVLDAVRAMRDIADQLSENTEDNENEETGTPADALPDEAADGAQNEQNGS